MLFSKLWCQLKKSVKELALPTASLIGLAGIVRVILSFSNSIAKDGKPPLLHTVCSCAAFVAMLVFLIVVFLYEAVSNKNFIYSHSEDNPLGISEIFIAPIKSSVINIAALGIYIGIYILLSFDGSYFEYYFSNMIPPIGYSKSDFGMPFIIWTVVSAVAVILALHFLVMCAFVFAKGKKSVKTAAVCAFLLEYAVTLILFVTFVLSNVPDAELFSNYLISGNYAHVTSLYLALAISLLAVAIIASTVTVFNTVGKNGKENVQKEKYNMTKRHL